MDRVLADEIEYDRINTANDVLSSQQLEDFKVEVWDYMMTIEHLIDADFNVQFKKQSIESINEALEEIGLLKDSYSHLGWVDNDQIWQIIWENPSW